MLIPVNGVLLVKSIKILNCTPKCALLDKIPFLCLKINRTVTPARLFIILSFLLIALHQGRLTAQPWEFVEESEDIKVYTRVEPGHSLKSFKGEAYIRSDIAKLANLLGNANNFDWWDEAIRDIRVLEFQPEKYIRYYLVYDVPWPLYDRDLCVEAFITSDPATGTRTVYARSLLNVIPEEDDMVRIKDYWQKWTATPMPDGMVHLILEGYADPGGYIPDWLYNMVITNTPINVIKKVRDRAK